MTTVPKPAADLARADRRLVAIWLFGVCALLALMVVVGGATRLTESGLSITEWRPITGAVPPLSEAAWEAEFEKYRQIPEYQLVNKGMSLDEFKTIYWWEWGHRLLGRLIGLAFFVPFAVLLAMGRIERALVPRLIFFFVLGGSQGALGWWMVSSGLADRVDVSQYRLAAHLALAFFIFALILWTALSLWQDRPDEPAVPPRLRRAGAALTALIFLQIVAGAFVAGLRAGHVYNTWPLMDGSFVPGGYWFVSPWYLNFFENAASVQFNHRILAYGTLAAVVGLWFWARRAALSPGRVRRMHILLGACLVQLVLGIATLLAVVPVWLGVLHQAGALALFAAALYAQHGLASPDLGRGRGRKLRPPGERPLSDQAAASA